MANKVDQCKGCGQEAGVEGVEVLPLDPIDHSVSYIPLCPECREWADARNAIASEIGVALRDRRAELGDEYADALDATPERPEGLQPDQPGVSELLEQ